MILPWILFPCHADQITYTFNNICLTASCPVFDPAFLPPHLIPRSMSNAVRTTVQRKDSKQEIKPIQTNVPPVAPSRQSASGSTRENYVYFDRSTVALSDDAIPRAKTAQLKLEHFYKVAVNSAMERNAR